MTTFEVIVPLIALAIAFAGLWYLRRESKAIDRDMGSHHHPAE